MEPLKTSAVHGNLESKPKILGFEMPDLVGILLFSSVMNLIFGNTGIGAYMTFVPSAVMAGVLFFAKRGKPDGYLVHLVRYHSTPGFYAAGEEAKNAKNKRFKIYEKSTRIP